MFKIMTITIFPTYCIVISVMLYYKQFVYLFFVNFHSNIFLILYTLFILGLIIIIWLKKVNYLITLNILC